MNVGGGECPKRLPDHLTFFILLVKSHLDIIYAQQDADMSQRG